MGNIVFIATMVLCCTVSKIRRLIG